MLVSVAVEREQPTGFGPFLIENVEPGARVITDGWSSYPGATRGLYVHEPLVGASGPDVSKLLPGVHKVSSLVKRWLLGTHQGLVHEAHLASYLDEFAFRFSRRRSRSRGLVFYRVLDLAVAHEPVRHREIVAHPSPGKARRPPPVTRGRPPSLERPPAGRDVERLASTLVDTFGRVDVLFNNAGISESNPARVHEYSTSDWEELLLGRSQRRVLLCEALSEADGRAGQRQGHQHRVDLGGVGAAELFQAPGYTAAKGAVVNLTHELGLEYATDGIQVNAICPGFFATRLANGVYDDPEFVSAASTFTPAGRVAEASEIRGAGIFLASAASDFMTGQTSSSMAESWRSSRRLT